MPKVSVCIPAYNYAHFLPDAIESVLCQTLFDFELIIVDNCSIDNTENIVTAYVVSDSRVSYYRNEVNIGLVGNLNKCIKYAQGDYVKILCADDLLEPTCLEKMAYILDTCPHVKLVACSRTLTDSFLNPGIVLSFSRRKLELDRRNVIKKCLLYGNLIGEPSAVLFRRRDAHRGFNQEFIQLVDLEMWFHLLKDGFFSFLPDSLCLFRQHDGQGTKANVRAFNYLDEEDRMFAQFEVLIGHKPCFTDMYKRNFRMALDIWAQRNTCDNPEIVIKLVDRYLNRYLFYLLFLPTILFTKISKIVDSLFLSNKQS